VVHGIYDDSNDPSIYTYSKTDKKPESFPIGEIKHFMVAGKEYNPLGYLANFAVSISDEIRAAQSEISKFFEAIPYERVKIDNVPLAITYRDRNGETIISKIEIKKFAKSWWDDNPGYYISAFCRP
jgi:hypothetical protein